MKRSRRELILFFGEGAAEEAFLKCVRNNFNTSGKNIKIIDGYGGSPISLVEHLVKNELFDPKGVQFILMDHDRHENEINLAKKEIKKHTSIKPVIFSQKCLEEELLKIISPEDSSKFAGKTSRELKDIFKKKCKSMKDYERIFTREALMQGRVNNKWLNSIIGVFE